MPRETMAAKRERAKLIEERMHERYGDGECSLDYETPFQLVVAVVLSAQCTDAAVNRVTPALFEKYPTPAALGAASIENVEEIIHSLGFFRSKAKHLVQLGRILASEFDSIVPNDMEQLQKLPGVGRKTANVVMCEAFRNPQGIAVDTHVYRIAHRLKLAGPSADTPEKTERALMRVYEQPDWLFINHQWVHFGREFCRARNPLCADCPVCNLCPSCEA